MVIYTESFSHHDDDYYTYQDDDIFPPDLNYIDEHRERIEQRMLHSDVHENDDTYSMSFTEQMQVVEVEQPDIIFFTMNSAIPLADAVRGWKEITGTKTPELAPIMANRAIAYAESDRMRPFDLESSVDNWLKMTGYMDHPLKAAATRVMQGHKKIFTPEYSVTHPSKQSIAHEDAARDNRYRQEILPAQFELQEELRKAEIQRLQSRYMGAQAIILDQYTYTGRTLATASEMLTQARVNVIEGASQNHLWYGQYVNFDPASAIDYAAMTTEYRDFMKHIGRTAAGTASSATY